MVLPSIQASTSKLEPTDPRVDFHRTLEQTQGQSFLLLGCCRHGVGRQATTLSMKHNFHATPATAQQQLYAKQETTTLRDDGRAGKAIPTSPLFVTVLPEHQCGHSCQVLEALPVCRQDEAALQRYSSPP